MDDRPGRYRLVDATLDGDGGLRLRFDPASDRQAIARAVTEVFTERRYRLESGAALAGVWGSGSALLRALVGGLARRSKLRVRLDDAPDRLDLVVEKAMSGAFGGVLGWQRMKAEALAVGVSLRERFERGGDGP